MAEVLEFQLQHESFQWLFGVDSFRRDWLDLLAVQGTLKSLLQHQSSKASILRCSAFFIVQLSHPYVISFRIDLYEIGLISLQSKGLSIKGILCHHSLKASLLQHSAFFMVQLSYLYMTTGKIVLWLYGPWLCNSHTIQFTRLKCMTEWFLVYSESCSHYH